MEPSPLSANHFLIHSHIVDTLEAFVLAARLAREPADVGVGDGEGNGDGAAFGERTSFSSLSKREHSDSTRFLSEG